MKHIRAWRAEAPRLVVVTAEENEHSKSPVDENGKRDALLMQLVTQIERDGLLRNRVTLRTANYSPSDGTDQVTVEEVDYRIRRWSRKLSVGNWVCVLYTQRSSGSFGPTKAIYIIPVKAVRYGLPIYA